jgi:hypothetical protein
MAAGDHNVEEKQVSTEHIPESPAEKVDVSHHETAHVAAERGHVATDAYVARLVPRLAC